MNHRSERFIPGWLADISLSSVLLVPMPVDAADTGLRGTVLWGPVKPGPASIGQSDEVPFSATFIVFSCGREVTRFQSDKQGTFEVKLPAGDYTIVPEGSTPIRAPQNQRKSAAVTGEGFTCVTLRFDTGMR